MPDIPFEIETLPPGGLAAAVPELAEVLQACVAAGASVGFVLPFDLAAAAAFWRGLVPSAEEGERRVLVARRGPRIVGTAQLLPSHMPNGRHRAEVAKVLVHPQARRLGIATALMRAVERLAVADGRSLLVLDTVPGTPAEALYRSLGYRPAGIIPAYAEAAEGGRLDPTCILYKTLPETA
ncbi:N-acetyltransferase family protein [Bordetella sp. 2513F-2]